MTLISMTVMALKSHRSGNESQVYNVSKDDCRIVYSDSSVAIGRGIQPQPQQQQQQQRIDS